MPISRFYIARLGRYNSLELREYNSNNFISIKLSKYVACISGSNFIEPFSYNTHVFLTVAELHIINIESSYPPKTC